MKTARFLAVAMFAVATISPAPAQRTITKPGNYVDVSDVEVLPGQFENYMDFLKANWVKQQEWAKQKGYIVGYRILQNLYPRKGEPNIFLLTEYASVPTNAEVERRQDEYAAMMKMDEHAMDEAAVKRGPMRTIGSQSMLQEVILK